MGLRSRTVVGTVGALAAGVLVLAPGVPASGAVSSAAPAEQSVTGWHGWPGWPGWHRPAANARILGQYKHLVVIYQENHSFDNLYGGWGRVNGTRVDGVAQAPYRRTRQVTQEGQVYPCLPQNDVNLVDVGPLGRTCTATSGGKTVTGGRFPNRPFLIDRYIRPTSRTCPQPGVSAPNGVKDPTGLPGGCTRDLVHRFYQEHYQIDGGRQDRYVTGSDAIGLTMGRYATRRLPVYRYLHSRQAPNYVVADRFFQAAFGGSFLNHQWLIAARTPTDTSGGTFGGAKHSVLDSNGFPNAGYPLYTPTRAGVEDNQLTQACGPTAIPGFACGDYAVNTVQPASPPFAATGAKIPLIDDAKYPNIGDRLTAAGVTWNWYSGGWDDAAAGHPGPLFQYHHQPFNYFAAYAPGTPGRHHLQDEERFFRAAAHGNLPTVSFVKPYGAENEHPGYASEPDGSDHLVKLLKAVTSGPQADDTLVVVTYDEFGGQWDHVSPPGSRPGARGVHDEMGPGTRIPALLISTRFRHDGVDSTTYDTTSILATIERSLGLKPLSSRDERVNDLRAALHAGGVRHSWPWWHWWR